MAFNVANTLNNKLTYAGMQSSITSATTLNFGCRVKFNSVGVADKAIIAIMNTSDASSIQVYLDISSGGNTNVAAVMFRDSTNPPIICTSGDEAWGTTGVWYSLIGTAVITAGTLALDVYMAEEGDVAWTHLTQATGTYNASGFQVTGGTFRLGGRNSDKVADAIIEDVFISKNVALTSDERTALLTQSARKALANTASTVVFMPDLCRYDFKCRASGVIPTHTSQPVRSLHKTLDYGRGPTFAVIGDWQHVEWQNPGNAVVELIAQNIADLKDSFNLVAAMNVGDLVNTRTEITEREAAENGLNILMAEMPTLFALGNHDITAGTRSTANIATELPPTLMSNQDGYVSTISPIVYGVDNYTQEHNITVGNEDWCVIIVPWSAKAEHFAYARSKALATSADKVFLLTHALVTCETSDLGGPTDDHSPTTYGSLSPPALDPVVFMEDYFRDVPKLALAFGGHYITSSENNPHCGVEFIGSHDNTAYVGFVNWQEYTTTVAARGGDGLVRFIELGPNGQYLMLDYFAQTEVFSDKTGNTTEFSRVEPTPVPVSTYSKISIGLSLGI